MSRARRSRNSAGTWTLAWLPVVFLLGWPFLVPIGLPLSSLVEAAWLAAVILAALWLKLRHMS
jgi:hypothetical protein